MPRAATEFASIGVVRAKQSGRRWKLTPPLCGGCSVDQQNAVKPPRRAGDVDVNGQATTARCHVTAERRPGRIVQVVLELDAIGVTWGGLPGERELLSGERG